MMRLTRRRHISLDERDELRMQRSNGIRGVLAVVAIILLVIVAFVASMVVLSPLFELYSLQEERDLVIKQLEQAQREETKASDRFRWMMDPEFFEQMARDRANMAKEHETVIRRPSAADHKPLIIPQKG